MPAVTPKVAALMERGSQLMQAASYLDAARAFERAAQQNPTFAEAHAMRADALMRAGSFDGAMASVERAMRLRPEWPEGLVLRGNIEAMLGRHENAERTFRQAIGKLGATPELSANLGHALRQQQRWADALEAYELALRARPESAYLYLWKGEMLQALDRAVEAERAFRHAIGFDPLLADAQRALAAALQAQQKFHELEAVCRLILERDPTSTETIEQLSEALASQDRGAEAEAVIAAALDAAPENVGIRIKHGTRLWRSGKRDEAIKAYRHAAELAQSRRDVLFIEAKVDEAVSLLALGRWKEGWNAYHWRYDRTALKGSYPDLIDEPWRLREATAPLRIRLRTDQGLGDELFFLRFAPALRRLGHRLALLTGPKLIRLLSPMTDIFDVVEGNDAGGPEVRCDAELLCSDLPVVTQEHTPPSLRFHLDPARVQRLTARLRAFGQPPYVGVTWRAGPTHDEHLEKRLKWVYAKQIPIEELAAILRPLSATVIVMQRRVSITEIDRFAQALGRSPLDLSEVHEDLQDSLALLSLLDEYIGVSSTNMHLLAGLEGKRAHVLVQTPAEWRWGLEGESSPWFEGFRIYRQTTGMNWQVAFNKLAEELSRSIRQKLC
jgi:tetratricopeptide (TPR) repeat protein